MADFDAFSSNDQVPQNIEEDPAADFLAREQTELAGLEDDNFGTDNSVPQGDQGNDFDPFGGQSSEPVTNGDMGGGSLTDDLGFGGGSEEPQTNGPTDMYAAVSQVDRQRAEPEKLRIWRENQEVMLQKKDEEEAEKKEEWREMAKKEVDDWYKHHGEQVEKTKETNRAAEASFVKDRDTTQPGGEWEKICRLCEFNPKNSKNTKDVSRMRSILLQLKQTPLVR
ncbi:hypothetical protein FSP39_016583 [Pinctada imbricata]|uniref:Clathrin light chain n=1 Tax=Pinctada imbricata TaxID=66713 RepID=A0AA88XLU1_PINIB|nr:hypothetical protein FSP39_016583 [Pinctada imbricata]